MKGIEALDQQALQQVRIRQAIINQYKIVTDALENEIMMIVMNATGVDVFRENWHIDLDRGILRKQEDDVSKESPDALP